MLGHYKMLINYVIDRFMFAFNSPIYICDTPWHNPRKTSRSLIIMFALLRCFFHLWPPIWAHMGRYGPVWTRISFDVALIWIICGFYIVFIWFGMVLYMTFDILDIFWKRIVHICYYILRLDLLKDHFASPPARKFALLCKCYFPRFLKSHGNP